MFTIARTSRFTRPPLSDAARRRCESDDIGLECDEPLPFIEPALPTNAPVHSSPVTDGLLYSAADLGEERPRRPRRRE